MTPNPPQQHDSPTENAPIADLSYRSYDGPLNTHAFRWWIVALAGIRITRKKPFFWVVAALGLLPYVLQIVTLLVTSQNAALAQNPFMPQGDLHHKYATHIYTALNGQLFWMFAASLFVGPGSIAADNRANALLVYLSKPITKADYLLGKWMSIFLTLWAIALAPALLLWAYCFASAAREGFLANEPLLLPRLIIATAVPAVVHASLLTGFSAWSKTPRLAGGIYAGAYIISNIIAPIIWAIKYRGHMEKGLLLRHLSIQGLIEGLVQNVLGVTLKMPRLFGPNSANGFNVTALKPPPLLPMVLITAVVCLLGVAAARYKIRAVEVVRG